MKDYEIYSGLRFKDRKIHQDTVDRKPPINFVDKKSYESKYTSQFKYCIDIAKDSFKERDYDVWAIAFKNKDGEEIARIDASEDEINNLFNDDPKDDFIRLWRNFDTLEVPNSWLVWPHSKSKDWLEIIEGNIPIV